MIGIDIIKTERFKTIHKSSFASWNRFFSRKEWAYAFSRPSPSDTLAGIFAAKEAVAKSKGKGLPEALAEIEIFHSKNGAPYARVRGQAKRIPVSISHDGGMAAAVAILC